ncbi:PEPxxWA-CTERM sorting domain-containing protein [Sphingomonas phyllosphaerae]|uniref:PEPxxWA-CTERM sorting domain-containing protein n=1 Tax=Sphingomonas phyllosphaerae TaxID=257003 RepID=UPI0004295D26|nr:PEPxxWA-CTERM sorting domain-containing protein [Sphingomonas phyllosphaerae]
MVKTGKILLLATAVALPAATPARAAVVVERAIASNAFGYFVQDSGRASLDSTDATSGNEGQHFTFFNAAGSLDGYTQTGLQFTGYANEADGGFFFLHNNFCVGMCAVGSSTRITFDILNDSAEAVDLRFDSLITPGHLAKLGQSSFGEAGFDFSVRQDPNTANGRTLYSASGVVNDRQIAVTTSDGVAFNGLTNVIREDNWTVLDWGATNLNLGLGLLGAGQRTTVIYEATYYAGTFDSCLDLTACSGVQVVFGDPRTNGGGSNARMALGGPTSVPVYPPRDAINDDYVPYTAGFAVNLASDPLPGPPPAMPVLTYNNGFTPATSAGAVPEPSTWLTMILGFGAIGASLRARRRHGRMPLERASRVQL